MLTARVALDASSTSTVRIAVTSRSNERAGRAWIAVLEVIFAATMRRIGPTKVGLRLSSATVDGAYDDAIQPDALQRKKVELDPVAGGVRPE